MNNSTTTSFNCSINDEQFEGYFDYINLRFWFNLTVGGSIALVGIICTLILMSILVKQQFRKSFCLYFGVLSIFDLLILINYFVLIFGGLLYLYFVSLPLYKIYTTYVRFFFVLARVTQQSQTYIIVAATIERFIVTIFDNIKVRYSTRVKMIIVAIVLAFLARSVGFWEVEVISYPMCTNFSSVMIEGSSLFSDKYFRDYKIIFEPFIVIYVPFTILFLMNLIIVVRLRWNARNTIATSEGAESQQMLKNATLSTVAIVSCYLISNLLNLSVSILELTNRDVLDRNPGFYTIATDLSSVLVVATSSIRIIVYYLTNGQIKAAILKISLISFACVKPEHEFYTAVLTEDKSPETEETFYSRLAASTSNYDIRTTDDFKQPWKQMKPSSSATPF